MKLSVLLVLIFFSHRGNGAAHKDNLIFPIQFKVETGYFNTIFIKKRGYFGFYPNNINVFPKYIGMIRGTSIIRDIYYLSLDYRYYSYSNYGTKSFEPGTLLARRFHALNLNIGRKICTDVSKVKFYPYFSLCARPNGMERVLVAPGIYGDLHGAYTNAYKYHSFGFGIGTTASILLFKHFSASFDLHYSFLFERKNTTPNPYSADGFEESKYKVNRQMLSPSIVLGYAFYINNGQ